MCSVGPFYGSKMKLAEFAESALKSGYDGIEIGLDGVKWPEEIKKEEITAVKKAKIPVGVHLPFNYLIVDDNGKYSVINESKGDYFINSIKKAIKFAGDINAEYSVHHPVMQFITNRKINDEIYFDILSIAKTLAGEVELLCHKKNIELCMENIVPYFDSPIEIMKEFVGLSENINVCFDIGINMLDDAELKRNSTWKDWFKTYNSRILTVHYSDISKSNKLITHHMKIGKSDFDFESFFKEAKKSGVKYLVSEEAFSSFSLKSQKEMGWGEKKQSLAKIKEWLK